MKKTVRQPGQAVPSDWMRLAGEPEGGVSSGARRQPCLLLSDYEELGRKDDLGFFMQARFWQPSSSRRE